MAVPGFARHYQYDRTGKPLAIRDARFGTTVYAYDAIGRLLQANEERFAFDPASNILDTNRQGMAAIASVRAPRWPIGEGNREHPFDIPTAPPTRDGAVVSDDRIRTYGDQRYAYDAHGNLVEKRIGVNTVMRFAYDPHHRMVSAEVTRGSVMQRHTYYYDALGRRVRKRGEAATTRFVWDGDALLIEAKADGTRCYIYGEDTFVPIAQVETQADDDAVAHRILHYHTDHIGTPHALTLEDGALAWQASYQTWGATAVIDMEASVDRCTPELQPLRFQGQYHDVETGLHYNRHRYYDPGVGRFISKDPIGLAGGSNSYQYAPNPLLWVDPLGLQKTYQTYTKANPATGHVYTGRTSGCKSPTKNIAERDSSHHMNALGYDSAVLDQSSDKAAAIRGREQMLIDAYGGAQSMGGSSGNAINGISPRNPKLKRYMEAAKSEFGSLGIGGVNCAER
jgi:RHS repeat-associated protein